MTQGERAKEETKSKWPFPLRVLLSALPVALIMLPLLWLLEYPAEEWPFIAGVFTLSLIGSGTLVSLGATLAVKRVYDYACAVAAKRGVNLNDPEQQSAGSQRIGTLSALLNIALLVAASWGLALFILGLVMSRMAMDPLGAHFSLIALTLMAVGATGFAFVIGGLTWFFYTVDKNPQHIGRLSRQFQHWLIFAGEIGRRRNVSGISTLTGGASG